jgi:hypothetical protein
MRKHVITAATAIMLDVAATNAGTIAFVAGIGASSQPLRFQLGLDR